MSAPAASSGASIYRLGTCRIIWNALDDDVRLHLENANFRLERKDQLACMVDTRGEAVDLASQIIGHRIKETSTLPQHLWEFMQAARAHLDQTGGHRSRRLGRPSQYLEQVQRDLVRQLRQNDDLMSQAQVIKRGLPTATN